MKILTNLLILLLLSIGVQASAASTTLGDGWPWPWGSECPFPWTTVEGNWEVKSLKREKKYDAHVLSFTVEADNNVGTMLLAVEQYNENGKRVATGQGLAEGNGRIISAVMDPVSSNGKAYKVMVRSYVKNANVTESSKVAACAESETIMAVTFCPMNGKKCMISSNYTLVKPQNDK